MEYSPTMEEYAKHVYQLEQEHSRRVRTVELAEAVDRTEASATHMIQQLDDEGLVAYREYRGVSATERGERLALRLVRNHRLIETFLVEQLSMPWSEVHEEADRLEHHISEEFADRLAELLGNPRTDPHGDPIPDAELTMPDDHPGTELTDCDPGDTLVVEQVPHHQSAAREYLFEHSIDPGSEIELVATEPVGLVRIRHHETDRIVSIPDRVARQITVRPLSAPDEGAMD